MRNRTSAPGGPLSGLGPVPEETYRVPERGAGAVHAWQGSDTGKYSVSAIREEEIRQFDNHLCYSFIYSEKTRLVKNFWETIKLLAFSVEGKEGVTI